MCKTRNKRETLSRAGRCWQLLSLLLFFLETMFLQWTHEETLLLVRLEATVTELRRGVDETEIDLFAVRTLGVENQRFAQGDRTFLRADAATFDHDEIVFHLTVMRKATLNEPVFALDLLDSLSLSHSPWV